MIRSTFLMLPGVGQDTELRLWRCGITSWETFLRRETIPGISSERKQEMNRLIMEAKHQLHNQNSSFFVDKLPGNQIWRLYSYFREECAFVDIESSSTSASSYITVIGVFDGYHSKIMVRNINLDSSTLRQALHQKAMLVTFNGSSFDLPMIAKKFPGVLCKVAHLDLRHLCASLDLCGGLKEVEKQLGIKRENSIVRRMYGGDPITLWRMFLGSGDEHYLHILMSYNEEDCVNLQRIADVCVQRMTQNMKELMKGEQTQTDTSDWASRKILA